MRRKFILNTKNTPVKLYVKPNPGSTAWDDKLGPIYTDLQEAINAADIINGAEIWVSSGTYLPSQYIPSIGAGDTRDRSFYVPQGNLVIYGGFIGTENDISERAKGVREWDFTNETILSGDHGGGDANKSYHVVYHDRAVSSPTIPIDGFTISGGNASGTGSNRDKGGGVLDENNASNTGLQMKNCQIINNLATQGGGYYTVGNGPSDAPLYRTLIANNTATTSRGGMYGLSTYVTECKFLDNEAPNYAQFYLITVGIISLCEIIHTSPRGDTVRTAYHNNDGYYHNCYIKNQNIYINQGGRLINCTIIDGYHTIVVNGSRTQKIHNTIIKTSQSVNTSGTSTGAKEVFNSLVENLVNTGDANVELNNLLGSTDPLFTNPGSGDYTLRDGSPCVNAGDDALVVTSEDLLENPRIFGDAVDMGGYENQNIVELFELFTFTDTSGTVSNLEIWTHDTENVFVDWGDGDLQELTDQTLTVSDIIPTNITIYSKVVGSTITKIISTNNTYAFDISDLPSTLELIQMLSASAITGDLNDLPSGIVWHNLNGNTVANIYTSGHTFDSGLGLFTHLPTSGNGLTSTMVDNLLIDLNTAGITSATVQMDGFNAARTAASDAAVTAMQGRSCTILTN